MTTSPPSSKPRLSLKRAIPLVIIVAGFAAFMLLGGGRYVSFEALSRHHAALADWVAAHRLPALAVYFLIYVGIVAFSLPGASMMTMLGGFLFGVLPGGALAVGGATLGAGAIFLATKTALGEALEARAKGWAKRLEDGFRENAFNYLLTLRLIPAVPFWLLNIVPAFLGVSLRTFMLATAIGILPGTFVYASVGSGLEAVLAAGDRPDFGIIFRPEILLPILGLAALSLLPVLHRKLKRAGPALPEGRDDGQDR